MKNNRLFKFALVALTLMQINAAQAQFSGSYAPANWTFYSNTNLGGGDGYVDFTNAPASIVLAGSDAGAYCCDGQEDLSITICATGFISFDYSHVNPDLDDAWYFINGVETMITSGGTGSVAPIAVNSGDVFGFRVKNYDDCCGRGILTISNFSRPTADAADFDGTYAPANWTFYSNTNLGGGDGYVNVTGAPLSIELGGSDAGVYCCNGQEDYEIMINYAGNISFDYSHVNPDVDDAWYYINGIETPISSGGVGSVGPIAINAGDVFGFRVKNYDDCCGRGVLTITNFTSPNYFEAASVMCAGDTTMFGTQALTTGGTYTEVFDPMVGCDSTVILTLTENPTLTGSDAVTICTGDTTVFGTQTLTAGGVYTEVFSSLVTGCDSTVTLTITENTPPTISVVSTSDEITGNDGAIDLDVTGGSTYTYVWDNADTTQDITGLAGGDYTVIVTDSVTGCSSTEVVTVNSQVGIVELLEGLFEIFPNPSNGVFNVTVKELNENMEMTIISSFGQQVLKTQITEATTKVDISGIASGTYFVRVMSAKGNSVQSIIIK